MSQMNVGVAPEWDLSDRLLKSMRHAGLSASELGERIGVHRNTINNYTSGRIEPNRRTLIAWAMATGVRLDWLQTGSPGGDGPGGSRGVTDQYANSITPITQKRQRETDSRSNLMLPLRKVS